MLEPVEIDINMNQNVSEESQKAAAANKEMTDTIENMQQEIERLKKASRDLSVALAEQKKMTAESGEALAAETQKTEELQKSLDAVNRGLELYESICQDANKASKEGADVTQTLVSAKNELALIEEGLRENTTEMLSNQESINEALNENKETTDSSSLSNKVMSESIKGVCDSLGIENTQLKHSLSNTKFIAAAKNTWKQSTDSLSASLNISRIAAQALMTVGILALVGAIVLVVSAVKSWYEANDANSRTLENMSRLNEKAASKLGDLKAKYEQLRREWQSAGSDLKAKEKLVLKNIEAYNSFGVAIRDVTDADNLFVNNTEAVEDAMTRRALAAASIEMASEKYKESIQKMLDAETRKDNPTFWDKVKGGAAWFGVVSNGGQANQGELIKQVAAESSEDLQKEGKILQKEAQDFIKKAAELGGGAAESIKENSKQFYEQIRNSNQKLMDLMTKDEIGSAAWNKAKKARDEAAKMLTQWDSSKTKSPKDTSEKASVSLEKKAAEYQKRINDARIRAMQEGAQRERETAKAEYEETKAYIEQQWKDIAALEKKTGKPATEQRTALIELDSENLRQYEAETNRINSAAKKTLEMIFTEVNNRFASDLERGKSEIKLYYDNLIEEAKRAGATVEEINKLIAARDKDTEQLGLSDQLAKLDFKETIELEKAAHLESIGLTTVAEEAKFEIVKKYLTDRIALLRQMNTEESNQEADLLEQRLKGMQKSPKSITGLVNNTLYKKMKEGFEKAGLSAADSEEKTNSFFESLSRGGATAVAVASEMKGMFGGLDEGLDGAMDAVGNIAQGFASGGPVGAAMAVVGEGMKLFSQYAQVNKEHQEALRKLALARLEIQREYNLSLLKEQLIYKEGSNAFGTDKIGAAVNSINTYRDAVRMLGEELKGTKPAELKGFNKINPFAQDAYKKQLQAYKDGIGALANIDIVTGSKKSGALWWRKRKDVYQPLLDVYDDIIDKEGKLNTARIESIMNNHKMSDENKALLQSLLDLNQAAEDAEQQLRDYLSETFGRLGNDLADSIVTAFHSGEDAAALFSSNVSDMLNDLSKQMVFSFFLKDMFDKLDQDIEQAYKDLTDDKITDEQLSKRITDVLGGFFGGLDGNIEKANDFLEQFWQNAEANGFERPDSQRQGASEGFANASQDSINELNGTMYAVRQIIGDIRQASIEELLVQRTVLSMMSTLVERSEYWEFLERLEDVANSLDSIEAYGLKLKMQ